MLVTLQHGLEGPTSDSIELRFILQGRLVELVPLLPHFSRLFLYYLHIGGVILAGVLV